MQANTTPHHTAPLTAYQRVRRAKDKAIQAGGKRLPDGIMPPPVAQAMRALLDAGYADSAMGVISNALLDAQRKLKRL